MNSPKKTCGGFTLIELLVVLSIVALITGVGLAVLSHSGRQFGFQAMSSQLVSTLRYARSNAVSEKGVSAVVVDARKKEIYSCSRRTFGLWHFEDIDSGNKSTGAFNNHAKLQGGAAIAPYGRVGSGLMIPGTGGYAECGAIPTLAGNVGISVECWISPTLIAYLRDRVLIGLSDGRITLADDDSIKIAYGALSFNTAPSVIPYERWTHLAMIYEPDYTRLDGSGTLSLYLNDKPAGQVVGYPAIPRSKQSFSVSQSGASFVGMIDQVRVTLLIETDKIQLENDITLTSETGQPFLMPFGIRFGRDGRLVQSAPFMLFTSTSTRDSFLLEVTTDGAVKIR